MWFKKNKIHIQLKKLSQATSPGVTDFTNIMYLTLCSKCPRIAEIATYQLE